LVVWIVGGLYTLLGSVCLTELGTMLPQAGGYYVYARRAFGDRAGFAVGWTDWLTYCAVLGYISIGLAEFVAVLVPGLAGAVTPVAVAALLVFVALQWGGIRISSRFQEVTTAIKFAAFVALVLGCLMVGRGPAAVSAPAPATFYGAIIALQSVVITYGGWQSALYFTEEDTDPARNLPRSMIGGVASVIAIYVLVNVALLRVLPIPALAHSTLPAADAAQIVTGRNGSRVIVVLSVVSLAPLLNAIMMIGTRIMYAMGRDGFLPRGAASVNAGGTPTVAMSMTTVVAVALIATGTFQKLVAVASFFLAANYLVCCLALVVMRRREPAAPRPFRAWGYPYSAVVVLAGAAAFLVSALIADTPNAAIAIALAAAGIIGHIIRRRALSRRFS
ncbi:MAG TPA: APC family permease, partial [Vicinamibacterales bacterium]|nr:APC family permease [Vicinamibacterales bacterium]